MNSPLQQLQDPLFHEKKVQVWMKRDDLIHPLISGNKWRKLKYNLLEAKAKEATIVSFGGAYSNHIHALAAAGKEYGIPTVGLIRGDELNADNLTLQDARNWGMDLRFVSREQYRTKEEDLLQPLYQQYPNLMVVPEGGANALAIKGVAELVKEIDIPYTHLGVAAGTGATAAGMLSAIADDIQVLAFSALKGDFLGEEINKFLPKPNLNRTLISAYHFGGYAKMNDELFEFIKTFKQQQNILLDPIYTSKMMFGMYNMIREDFFKPGSTIVTVHTGGLQGWRGWPDKYPAYKIITEE